MGINKAKLDMERTFSNVPVGSRLILGIPKKGEKRTFPVHGNIGKALSKAGGTIGGNLKQLTSVKPKSVKSRGEQKFYKTSFNGFMTMGQPGTNTVAGFMKNQALRQITGL